MFQRTSSLAALALAVGCQSAPTTMAPQADWHGSVEDKQEQMSQQMAELRVLLTELALEPTEGRALPLQPSENAPGETDLLVGLRSVGDRVDQLGAILSASGGAQPLEAAFRRANDPKTPNPGAVDSLRAAMAGLEVEHAAHCQNIANAGVPGYKRQVVLHGAVSDEESGLAVPMAQGTRRDMGQGVLDRTDRWLDLAIEGDGFFEVRRPDGTNSYTRTGCFHGTPDGGLATREGFILTDQVTVPEGFGADSLLITTGGLVFPAPGSSHLNLIGAVRVYVFQDASELRAESHGHFVPTEKSGAPKGRQPDMEGVGRIKQGYLERSNVVVAEELLELRWVERRAAAVRLALATHGIYSL